MRTWLSWAIVLVAACKGGPDDTDTGVDTDPDTDSDTVPQFSFNGYLVRPDEVSSDGHLRIALLGVDTTTWAVTGELSSTPLAGTGVFQMFLPDTPDAAGLAEAWPAHAGLRGAWWAPVVYDDEDQSNTYTLGEGIVAIASNRWLAWYEGTIPAGYPAAGWTEVTPDPGLASNEPIGFIDLGAEAELTLRGTGSAVRIGGTWAGPSDVVNYLAVLDRRYLLDEADASAAPFAVVDPSSEGFDVVISDRPATAQLYKTDPTGLWYAIAHPVVFEDLNGNRKFDPVTADGGDPLSTLTACSDGSPVHLVYYVAPTTIAQAMALDASNGLGGWRLMTGAVGADATVVPKAKTRFLEVKDTCVLSL